MYRIDWEATGSMVGGVGSIIAVGVAIFLSEVQHRRTLKMVREKDASIMAKEAHETKMLALWAAAIMWDLRNKAEIYALSYATISVNEQVEHMPADLDDFSALMRAFALDIGSLSPRLIDAIPKFHMDAGDAIASAVRMAIAFDQRNVLILQMARTGRLKTTAVARTLSNQLHALRKLVGVSEEAYRHLANAYELPTLESLLEAAAAEKEVMDQAFEARRTKPRRHPG